MKARAGIYSQLIQKSEAYFRNPRKGADFTWARRISHEVWRPGFRAEGRDGAGWVVAYVLAGAGYLDVRQRRTSLEPGMVLFLCSGVGVSFGCTEGRELEVLLVSCRGRRSSARLTRGLGGAAVAFPAAHPERVATFLRLLLDVGTSPTRTAQDICNRMLPILILMLVEERSENPGPVSRSLQLYQQIRTFLASNFKAIRCVQDVATHFGITAAYLSRLFRRFGGEGPRTHLQRLRMDHAANVLRTTPQTVKEVAFSLGYADPFIFSRGFRKWKGQPPNVYRSACAVKASSSP